MGVRSDSFRVLLTRSFLIVIAFLTQAVLARALGVDMRGSFAVCWSFFNILLMLSSFGVEAANIYYLATSKYSISQVLGASTWISICSEIVACFLGAFFISLPFAFFQKASEEHFTLAIIVVGLFVLSIYMISILRGSMRYDAMNSMNLLGSLAVLISTSALCFGLNLKVTGALIGASSGPLAIIVGTVLILRKDLRRNEIFVAFRLIPDILHYGGRAYLGYFAQTMNLQIGTFILAFLLPTSEVGFYAIAVSIISKLWIIPDSLCVVLMPKLAQKKGAEADLTCLGLRIILPAVSIAAIGLVFLSQPAIIYVFGKNFAPTLIAINILIVGAVFRSASKITTSYFLGINRPGINSIIKFFCIGLNIILPIMLVPYYGLVGGASATAASYVLESLIMLYFFFKISKISTWKLLIPRRADFGSLKDILLH